MFKETKTLYNIEELKNLNIENCTNFKKMFSSCELLSDIKPLEKLECIKLYFLLVCSVNSNHYLILTH